MSTSKQVAVTENKTTHASQQLVFPEFKAGYHKIDFTKIAKLPGAKKYDVLQKVAYTGAKVAIAFGGILAVIYNDSKMLNKDEFESEYSGLKTFRDVCESINCSYDESIKKIADYYYLLSAYQAGVAFDDIVSITDVTNLREGRQFIEKHLLPKGAKKSGSVVPHYERRIKDVKEVITNARNMTRKSFRAYLKKRKPNNGSGSNSGNNTGSTSPLSVDTPQSGRVNLNTVNTIKAKNTWLDTWKGIWNESYDRLSASTDNTELRNELLKMKARVIEITETIAGQRFK